MPCPSPSPLVLLPAWGGIPTPWSIPNPWPCPSTRLSLPSLPALGFVCKAPGCKHFRPARKPRPLEPRPSATRRNKHSASRRLAQKCFWPRPSGRGRSYRRSSAEHGTCAATSARAHIILLPPSFPVGFRPCSSCSPAPSWALHLAPAPADFMPWGIPPLTPPSPVAPGTHRSHRKRSESTFSLRRNHPRSSHRGRHQEGLLL